MLFDAKSILWSLKFLSNSRHVIGSHFDKLSGLKEFCVRVTRHYTQLYTAYKKFLDEYQGSYTPIGKQLSWTNPWAFFLDDGCSWSKIRDDSAHDVLYTIIDLPRTVVQDFGLSPAVDIVWELKSSGLEDQKVLELLLLCGYQRSWFRCNHLGRLMLQNMRGLT
jgi:hypothetical protein